MKNTKKIMMALLPVAAALTLASCSSDDDQISTPQSVNTIPYSVTVSESGTRAAFADGTYTGLVFAAGDKLYINNADGTVYGTLTMQSGSGTSSATFSGELSYSGTAPTAETALTATLLSADNEVVQITNHKAAPQYGGICANIAQAVSKYSYLSGSSTFGTATFALSQGTAFLGFNVTLTDGEAGSKAVAVKNNSSSIASGTVSGTGSVSFIAPVAAGTTLSNAFVWVDGWKPSTNFGQATTLASKVYEVSKTVEKATVPTDVNFIDLGLVVNGKKILWADRNYGASTPTDYGDYFQWGEVFPATSDACTWADYAYCMGTTNTLTKYVIEAHSSYYTNNGFFDNKTELAPDDNVILFNYGSSSGWDMPNREEITALTTTFNTDATASSNWYWEWCDGVNTKYENTSVKGYKITWTPGQGEETINPATNQPYSHILFLPAGGYRKESAFTMQSSGGYYLSSSLHLEGSLYADRIYFHSGTANNGSNSRSQGMSVRAIKRVSVE